MGFLAHELRNLVNTAMVSFDVLRAGNEGIVDSTGSVLHRSLLGIRALINQSLADVRLTHGVQHQEPICLSDVVDEVTTAAALQAHTIGIRLIAEPVDQDVVIEGDRQVLAAVVGNLVQNAFKFTRPRTAVTVRVIAGSERVLIEVEDECGGLLGTNPEDLFRPFEQHNRIGAALASASRSADGAPNQFKAGCMREVCPDEDVCSPSDLPRVITASDVATA